MTGARVLAVVRPREIPPERARRKADLRLPPLIDPTSDAYRLLASHASVAGPSRAVVTITGDVPSVTATIAANIAAVSANEMRSTLLVDADLENRSPSRRYFVSRRQTGIARMLDWWFGRSHCCRTSNAGWSRSLARRRSERERSARGPIATREAEVLRDAIARAARHYELTVIVSPFERANDVRVAPASARVRTRRTFAREHTPRGRRVASRQRRADHRHRALGCRRAESRSAVDLRELVRE